MTFDVETRDLARRAEAGDAEARVALLNARLSSGLGWAGEALHRTPGKGRLVPKRDEVGVYQWVCEGRLEGLPAMEFVHVPAGEAFVTSRRGYDLVEVQEFWVGRYPVTYGNLIPYRSATGGDEPAYEGPRYEGWLKSKSSMPGPPVGSGDVDVRHLVHHPATLVSWDEANRMAFDLGLSLPSEVQWRRAAFGGREQGVDCPNCAGRGSEKERWCRVCDDIHLLVPRHWPWGQENPTSEHAALGVAEVSGPGTATYQGILQPTCGPEFRAQFGDDQMRVLDLVPRRPKGLSWCGAADLIGNVLEWVSLPAKTTGPFQAEWSAYVACGSWLSPPERVRGYGWPDTAASIGVKGDHHEGSPEHGFRLVAGVAP